MDNFNYQAYLKSGRIHGEQAILTESEQVSEKKYKQGYDDREDESLGDRTGAEKDKKQSMKDRRDDSYGKFGKRDAEKKGKNKINKENLSETIAEAKAKIDEGSYPFDQCLADNEGKYGKKGAAKVCGAIKAQYGEGQVNEMDEVSWNDKNNPTRSDSVGERDPKKVGQSTAAYSVNEDARTDAEQEGYKDGFEDAKDDIEGALKKMKVSELKAKIKEDILSQLSEEEEVDVDVDVEDKVEVDAEADDIEIERPGVKTTIDVGLSPEEEVVQDSLKAAMDAANELGNQKLADQIGNTITFFTREFVVGSNTD